MDEATGAGGSKQGDPGPERTGSGGIPSWSQRVGELRTAGGDRSGRADLRSASVDLAEDGFLEDGLEQLRRDARQAARDDAERERPSPSEETSTEREALLRERCRALFERWTRAERRRTRDVLAEREERVSKLLGRAGLLLDRFERLINQLIRLKARQSTRRREMEARPDDDGNRRRTGLPTKVYASAIGFLGLVEFFANAPVFSTLLPRDPLTEQQIGVIAETSTGWLAGVERVLAQLVLRPDAALLAAGVVTFLCVLAHFFGHSLRELIIKKDGRARLGTTAMGSATENVVPIVLTGLGLVLVLGVLFQARVILGDVGERRYREDMEVVTELRREAGWLRTDGELLEANQLADRADDMEETAIRLREYAASMSRMTFPILLLNLTLVLAAITAAYFHRRDGPVEHLGEDLYENDREGIIEMAESTASEISDLLSQARRPIRALDSLSEDGFSRDLDGVAGRLESIVALYRRENARARGIAPDSVAAFRGAVEMELPLDGNEMDLDSFRRAAAEAQAEHDELSRRFREARNRFNEQLRSWGPDGSDA